MTALVALLGAESTGKTSLAQSLCRQLAAQGRSVALVPEYLREFCCQAGRTPHREEQAHIAAEQTRRLQAAAASHDIVIADTTALMTAVYSEQIFGDTTLYESALAAHRACTVTLLTALDLTWQADGLQRDGPEVREPVDALLRSSLRQGGIPYSVVAGDGATRLARAHAAVRHALARREAPSMRPSPWRWYCDRCSDSECERHQLALGGRAV